MLVSVVVPSTDRGEGLERCLNSILQQDFIGELEVLVVENNSKNLDVVQEILQRFNGERIHHFFLGDCVNANVARNFGASKAAGEYIAFLDSDDEWHPRHLAKCLDSVERSQCVCSSFFSVKNRVSTSICGHYSGDIVNDLFVEKSIDVRTSALFFLKKAFDVVRFDERLNKHQDWGLVVDFSRRFRIAYSNEPTVNIYVDGDNRMSAKTNVPASTFFAKNKLTGLARLSFILSRMSDEIAIGTKAGLVEHVGLLGGGFTGLSFKKRVAGIIFVLCSKSVLLFSIVRSLLGLYKSVLVNNK